MFRRQINANRVQRYSKFFDVQKEKPINFLENFKKNFQAKVFQNGKLPRDAAFGKFSKN